MYQPQTDDERTGIANYVDQQLDAVRASVFGLTEDQIRATPCTSALSVGGIVKHIRDGMRGALERLSGTAASPVLDEEAISDYLSGFVVGLDEDVAELLADFDALQADLRIAILATEPDAEVMAPPAPWHGIFEERPIRQRFYLGHMVEEYARHAGHADIIREQIDGMSVNALVLTIEEAPANDFFQPFEPPPGTIGSA